MTISTASAAASTTDRSTDKPIERGRAPSLVHEAVRAARGYYGRLGRIGFDLVWTLLPLETPPDRPASPVTSPTLLVEVDEGPGFGAFVVENLTAEPVAGPIQVSAFVDDAGHQVRPRLALRPSTVSLGPGERATIQVAAELDASFEAGVPYRGEIAIPGLSDHRIPMVLRRRHKVDDLTATEAGVVETAVKPKTVKPKTVKPKTAEPPAAEPAAKPTAAKPTKVPRRRRSTTSGDTSR